MVRYRAGRDFLKLKDSDFHDFIEIVGTNVSTKPEFASIVEKGTRLTNLNKAFYTAYEAVLAGDYRQREKRDSLRSEIETLSREICDDVNRIAAGDAVIISVAGLEPVTTPSKDRQMGTTTLLSVEYLQDSNMVKIRCTKADRAADYQVDISTDGTTWEEGVDSIPLTIFYILWKKPTGKYFIRLCPRNHMGARGRTFSNILQITIR